MIDWEGLKLRLKKTEEILAARPSLQDDKVKKTLALRAERLAQRSRQAKQNGQLDAALLIKVAGESFAVPVEKISEIVPYQSITAVPGAPAEVLGVINLRGEIVTVAKTSALLGLKASDGRGKFLLLRREGNELGIYVDQVEEIENLDFARFKETEASRFTRGVNPESISLLDCEAILDHPSFWGPLT